MNKYVGAKANQAKTNHIAYKREGKREYKHKKIENGMSRVLELN